MASFNFGTQNACTAKVNRGVAVTIFSIRHITTYRYKRPVSFGEQRMMLRPRESHGQRLLESKREITPTPTDLRCIRDAFGNHVAVACFTARAETLRFGSTLRLDHSPADIVETEIEEFAGTYPFSYGSEDMPDLFHLIERYSPDPARQLDQWLHRFLPKNGSPNTHALLVNLTWTIQKTFIHVAQHEKGIQHPLHTLKIGCGSCCDLAMLMIEAVRSLGMAARFVSGYLHVPHDNKGDALGGNAHVWVQVYLPGCGWVDFDPSNGIDSVEPTGLTACRPRCRRTRIACRRAPRFVANEPQGPKEAYREDQSRVRVDLSVCPSDADDLKPERSLLARVGSPAARHSAHRASCADEHVPRRFRKLVHSCPRAARSDSAYGRRAYQGLR